MKPKNIILSWAVVAWAVGAVCLSAATGVSAARVKPPPKPVVVTVIEPGEAARKNDRVTHGHHHKGHIKKDKTK